MCCYYYQDCCLEMSPTLPVKSYSWCCVCSVVCYVILCVCVLWVTKLNTWSLSRSRSNAWSYYLIIQIDKWKLPFCTKGQLAWCELTRGNFRVRAWIAILNSSGLLSSLFCYQTGAAIPTLTSRLHSPIQKLTCLCNSGYPATFTCHPPTFRMFGGMNQWCWCCNSANAISCL